MDGVFVQIWDIGESCDRFYNSLRSDGSRSGSIICSLNDILSDFHLPTIQIAMNSHGKRWAAAVNVQ